MRSRCNLSIDPSFHRSVSIFQYNPRTLWCIFSAWRNLKYSVAVEIRLLLPQSFMYGHFHCLISEESAMFRMFSVPNKLSVAC